MAYRLHLKPKSWPVCDADTSGWLILAENSGRRVLTSAHPVVVAQNISRGTHALVRAEGVDAAESAEERVHSALVDVWRHKIKPRVDEKTLRVSM